MSGKNTFNLIRQESSGRFREVVPAATEENILELRSILFNDSYQPELNEFVNNFINRIALTVIRNKSFSNPLAMFKKGSVPLGTDIQDIYTNPAKAEAYELNDVAMAKLLTVTDPETKVAYYRRNRQDLYTKTIAREALYAAFVSWSDFDKYTADITQSLYSGCYIDEFKYTKNLIDGAFDNDKVITEIVPAVTDEATARTFLKKCRALYNKLACPSTDYNAYSKFNPNSSKVETWTDKDRICVITTADVMAEVDVEALASAFNLDKSNFIGRVVVVDKFENEEIQGLICDEAFLQIYDNVFRFDEFYNARTMSWNEYLHAWGTWAICPFANAVMLVTEKATPATSFTLSETAGGTAIETLTVQVDKSKTIYVNKTPSTATSEIKIAQSLDERFVIAEADNATMSIKIDGEIAGQTAVRVVLDNGLEKTISVTVTE